MIDRGLAHPSFEARTAVVSRRDLLVAAGLAATAVAPLLLTRDIDTPNRAGRVSLDAILPDRIGPWTRASAEDVLIPRAEDAGDRVYDDVVTRYFVGDGVAPVMLLIAYGSAQTRHTQLHRPEICYPAAGFVVQAGSDITVMPGSGGAWAARTMTAIAPGRIEQIVYWSRVGAEFPTTTLRQRWSVFRQTLGGSIPDGVLVRLSTIDPDKPSAMRTLMRFADALLKSETTLRPLLVGQG